MHHYDSALQTFQWIHTHSVFVLYNFNYLYSSTCAILFSAISIFSTISLIAHFIRIKIDIEVSSRGFQTLHSKAYVSASTLAVYSFRASMWDTRSLRSKTIPFRFECTWKYTIKNTVAYQRRHAFKNYTEISNSFSISPPTNIPCLLLILNPRCFLHQIHFTIFHFWSSRFFKRAKQIVLHMHVLATMQFRNCRLLVDCLAFHGLRPDQVLNKHGKYQLRKTICR